MAKACTPVTKSGKKIHGNFCEKVVTPLRQLAPNSLRWKPSGSSWVMVGCPKGKFKGGVCQVGTRAHVVLTPRR